MKTYLLRNERDQDICWGAIRNIPLDGSRYVEIKKIDESSTARQRRLRYKWFSEVAVSGLGRADTQQGVCLDAKWMFARPMWIRDDEVFGIIYGKFIEVVSEYKQSHPQKYAESCLKFTDQYISIERMSRKQHAEFLREFERFWISKGVELTDPNKYRVDLKGKQNE